MLFNLRGILIGTEKGGGREQGGGENETDSVPTQACPKSVGCLASGLPSCAPPTECRGRHREPGGSPTGPDFWSLSEVCLPHHSTLRKRFSENARLKCYSKCPLFHGETRFSAGICEQLFFKEKCPEGHNEEGILEVGTD